MSQESFVSQKQDAKESILKKLAFWATKRELLQDPNVLDMIKDITEDRNLGFWANQDPLEFMPSVDSNAGLKFMNYAKIFALIRNVLIFLPVAVTWKAVVRPRQGLLSLFQ